MPVPAHVVTSATAGARLVDHLRDHLGVVVRRAVGPLIAQGAVQVDGRVGRIADAITPGQVIEVDAATLDDLHADGLTVPPSDVAVPIRFEDEDLLVADKPAGMHVHPMGRHRDDTLVGAMLWHAGARADHPWTRWRPHPVHRLDRPTSGLLLVAKSRAIQDAVADQFESGVLERTYHATVVGEVAGEAGTIDLPVGRDPDRDYRRAVVPVERGGQPALTHWRVLERHDGRTRLEVRIETGRTHQIRVHLAALGTPIVGDTLYEVDAARSEEGTRPRAATDLALRAVCLEFRHPGSGHAIRVSTTPGPDGAR